MSERSYIERLRSTYNHLIKSRVVNKGETDKDALEFFEHHCNESLPKTGAEIEFRTLIKNMYFSDKTAFRKCIKDQPFLILLTEARAFVVHLKVQNKVFIRWEGKSYTVEVNDNPVPEKYISRREHDTKGPNRGYKDLLERLNNIEKSINIEQIEPELPARTPEPEQSHDDKSTEKKKSWADLV